MSASSPNLIDFGSPPPASALTGDLLGLDGLSSVSLVDERAAPRLPAASGAQVIEENAVPTVKYASLHFFVSCSGVDGNLVATGSRSAQTLMRGAFSMLTQTSTGSSKAKPATDVAVQVVVSREVPLPGPGVIPAAVGDEIWGSVLLKSASVDSLTASDGEMSPRVGATNVMGTLDAESYWSEKRKSRSPNFSVGFNLRCQVDKFDRHVQIMIMIPDEGTHSYKSCQKFGYAQTSFQELYTIATSGNFKQKMTLPVHSSVFDGATVELRFVDIQPQPHPLFDGYHDVFRSYLFYPLMREDQEHFQASEAKLAIEEAAEVDFSVKIPLQLMRVCQEELAQMYDDWKKRYNYVRKVNRHFDDDIEALTFGYDAIHVQVICGRNLSPSSGESGYDNAQAGGSRPSAFAMGMAAGQGVFMNRLKNQAGRWGTSASSSSSFGDNGGDMPSFVNPFVVVKFGDTATGPQEHLVGKTNTEYESPNPIWSSNKLASKCQHGKPGTKFHMSTNLPSRIVVSPVNALKEFVFYRRSTRTSQSSSDLSGWLRFEVFNETYSYMTGVENEIIGEVMIPLQSVRAAMTVEDKVINNHDAHSSDASHQIVSSLTLVDWFDVRSPTTDECLGQIQLRLNITLANPADDNGLGIGVLDPTRCRRASDCVPPPASSPLDIEMPLGFLYAHVMALQNHMAEVTDSIRLTENLIEQKKTFKSSQHKKRADIQSIPTNLHVSYFRIIRNIGSQWRQPTYEAPSLPVSRPAPFNHQASTEDLLGLGFSNSNAPPAPTASLPMMPENAGNASAFGQCNMVPEAHATITCGAPTAHAMGLSENGLREMETEIHRLQSTMDKCTPRLASPSRISATNTNALIPEDEGQLYAVIDDSDIDDNCSTDSAMSSDVSAPVEPLSPTSDKETSDSAHPKRAGKKKYSMMAVRAAAGARVKATSKKRFTAKKSSRHLDHRDSEEHGKSVAATSASPAKYPVLRTDPDEIADPYTSTAFAARVLCQLERLRAEYYFRKSVAVSQAVSSLVTCFMAELDLCLQEQHEAVLYQFARIGFLIGWESLISSHGKELFMISDAWVAIKCLETFAFQLYESSARDVRLERREGVGYTIRVPVPSQYFTSLPEELRNGGLINVTSVLFTQGINEMQSLANMVRHSGVSIQSKINSTSLRSIFEYYKCFTDICGVNNSESSVGAHPDEILRNLRMTVESESSASKNTCILLHAGDAVRSLHGGRVTYCKSGKDRTAMSVTLEQARLVVQRKRHVLQEIESGSASDFGPLEEVKSVANTMRQFGARIEIARKNVGRYKYSFNSLQRKLLPEIYRPPVATIQDMVTSVTARDS